MMGVIIIPKRPEMYILFSEHFSRHQNFPIVLTHYMPNNSSQIPYGSTLPIELINGYSRFFQISKMSRSNN